MMHKKGSHGVRLTGSGRYGRPLIGRQESAHGVVAVVKGVTRQTKTTYRPQTLFSEWLMLWIRSLLRTCIN
ncbi:unnamed protein product, partial [Nesidiocoris tenuis]